MICHCPPRNFACNFGIIPKPSDYLHNKVLFFYFFIWFDLIIHGISCLNDWWQGWLIWRRGYNQRDAIPHSAYQKYLGRCQVPRGVLSVAPWKRRHWYAAVVILIIFQAVLVVLVTNRLGHEWQWLYLADGILQRFLQKVLHLHIIEI